MKIQKFKDYLNEKSEAYVNSKGIQRHKMPQITQEMVPYFIEFIKHRGISTSNASLTLQQFKEIKPTQSHFNPDKVQKMIKFMENEPEEFFKTKLLISLDGYLLDGHHRYSAVCSLDDLEHYDKTIDVVVINNVIESVLRYAESFPATFKAGVND